MGLFHLFGKKKEERLNNKEIISPIERVESLAAIIAQAWNKLDSDILAPHLSDNFQYNSAWLSNTMRGRDEYVHYLQGKFKTIKNSGAAPDVDVIEENGKMLPHLLQRELGVEAILDFDSIEGKITRMFMRPPLKITIVDEENWGEYAQAYHDFLPQAVQVAGQAIQDYANDRGLEHPDFAWLQTYPNHPSFQHLCFRAANKVYSIIIALHGFQSKDGKEDDSIVVFKRDYENLLCESKKNNLIPCIVPISARPGLPMLNGGRLINSETNIIFQIEGQNEEAVPMSEWEINNMGIFTVIDYLQKEGFSIISYCDVVGINPQIFCEKEEKKAFVVVRSIPIGLRNNAFGVNKNILKKLEGYEAYFADVQYANVHNNGDFEDKVLWRGDEYYCNFTGLQEMGKAISDNSVIVCDDKNYDIK